MSKGQAPSPSAQPHDVGALPASTTPMLHPSSRSLATPTIASDVRRNYTTDSYNASRGKTHRTTPHQQGDYFSPEVAWQGGTTDDYLKAEEEFYSSYDPQIGLHTAAVLGGILGMLVVYLLYKTKVKKCVVSFVKRKYKQPRKHAKDLTVCEAPDVSNNIVSTPGHAQDFSVYNHTPHLYSQVSQQTFAPVCGQEKAGGESVTVPYIVCGDGNHLADTSMGTQCPMPSIVVESYTSLPSAHPKRTRYKHKRSEIKAGQTLSCKQQNEIADITEPRPKSKRRSKQAKTYKASEKGSRINRKRSRSCGQQYPEVTVLDVDDPDTKSLLLPPASERDSARATARWVQNMPLLMQSYQDVTGLILKIQPSLVTQHKPQSCPLISAALQYAALPLLGLPHVYTWNKSMPVLTDTSPNNYKHTDLDSIFSDEKDNFKLDPKLSPLLLPQKVHQPQTGHRPQEGRGTQQKTHPHNGHQSQTGLKSHNGHQPQIRHQSNNGHQSQIGHQSQTGPQPDQSQQYSNPVAAINDLQPRPHSATQLMGCVADRRLVCGASGSSRRPPPRLTISIPDQAQLAAATSLFVPGPHAFLNLPAAMSAPASPVPLPVTPTVTIQNLTSRIAGSVPLQHRGSQESDSSASSIDPLLHAPLGHHPYPHSFPSYHAHSQPPSPAWIVFDNDAPGFRVGHSPACPSNGAAGRTTPRESDPRNSANPGAAAEAPDALLTLETQL